MLHIDISHNIVAKHVTGVLFLVWFMRLLLELHALTQATCSFALLYVRTLYPCQKIGRVWTVKLSPGKVEL